MKKIFTLIAMAMMAVAANAQVAFLSPDGKEYADGESFTITPVITVWAEDDIEAKFHSPVLKNTGSEEVSVSLGINVTALPEGTNVSTCYPEQCTMMSSVSKKETTAAVIAAGAEKETAVEWDCYDGEKNVVGTCTIEYTVIVNGKAEKTVTVHFTYNGETAVESITNNANVVKTFDLQGRETRASKGLLIEKLSNGQVRKVLK